MGTISAAFRSEQAGQIADRIGIAGIDEQILAAQTFKHICAVITTLSNAEDELSEPQLEGNSCEILRKIRVARQV